MVCIKCRICGKPIPLTSSNHQIMFCEECLKRIKELIYPKKDGE